MSWFAILLVMANVLLAFVSFLVGMFSFTEKDAESKIIFILCLVGLFTFVSNIVVINKQNTASEKLIYVLKTHEIDYEKEIFEFYRKNPNFWRTTPKPLTDSEQ